MPCHKSRTKQGSIILRSAGRRFPAMLSRDDTIRKQKLSGTIQGFNGLPQAGGRTKLRGLVHELHVRKKQVAGGALRESDEQDEVVLSAGSGPDRFSD